MYVQHILASLEAERGLNEFWGSNVRDKIIAIKYLVRENEASLLFYGLLNYFMFVDISWNPGCKIVKI